MQGTVGRKIGNFGPKEPLQAGRATPVKISWGFEGEEP